MPPEDQTDETAEAATVKAARQGGRKAAAVKAATTGVANAERVDPPPNPQAVTMPQPARPTGTALGAPDTGVGSVAELTPSAGTNAGSSRGRWVIAPCDAQEVFYPARAKYPVPRVLWRKGQTIARPRYEAWLAAQAAAGAVPAGVQGTGGETSAAGLGSGIAETVTVSPQGVDVVADPGIVAPVAVEPGTVPGEGVGSIQQSMSSTPVAEASELSMGATPL